MIGTKYIHNKRGSTYMVIEVVKSITGFADGDIIASLPLNGQIHHDIMVQISNGDPTGPWWIYENEQGKTFARPASEFTPDRFHKVVYLYTPDRCPSRHWADIWDTCEDCGLSMHEDVA
jgi:hypothetical protein